MEKEVWVSVKMAMVMDRLLKFDRTEGSIVKFGNGVT